MSNADFTPALGRSELTDRYDRAIRFWTRERRWRTMLLDAIAPGDGESILDVGSGTGTLAVLIKQRAPGATVVGVDPDPKIRALAANKAKNACVDIEFLHGFARDAADVAGTGRFDKVVSSLVFHQVPLEEKKAGLAAMHAALKPGGSIHVADYGEQRGWLMRRLFRIIQRLDGYENTQHNADGILPELFAAAGFLDLDERSVATPTGSISVFSARG